MNSVENAASPYSSTPDASPTVRQPSITLASFGIVDLRAVANQARHADDAECPGEAGADDQHHDAADDGEDDLGLNDHRGARRGAAGAWAERERRPQDGRERQREKRARDHRHVRLEDVRNVVRELGRQRF